MDTQKEQFKKAPAPARNKIQIANFLNKSLESYIEFEEKWADALAKFLTKSFGTLRFLILILVFLSLWIIINFGLVPGINPFDLYPFVWLIISVQLFAVVLSIIVLISQNQEARINEVRQQMEFEINVRAEQEITKVLYMIEAIHTKLGIVKVDKELEQMKETINISEIKEDVEQVIEEKNNTSGIT
ncbi:MAG: DUF1003 domain-containing protein [bacterium]|nr:DUF1003 domain-containing protein [bacterium]